MLIRGLLLSISFLAPFPAAADLAGRWLSLGPTHLYDVPQHIEVLEIAPDGDVTVLVWRLDPLIDATCPDPARPDCTNPLPVARGRIEAIPDSGHFRIHPEGPVSPPFPDPRDVDAWAESSALAAEGWQPALSDDRLALTRPISLGRRDFTLTRLFHRVDSGFDAQFFHYHVAMFQSPLWGSTCGLDAVLADPGLRKDFTDLLAATADVLSRLEAERRAFEAERRQPVEEDWERPFFVFLRQVSGGAQDLGVPDGFDPDGWARILEAARWVQGISGHNGVLFPGAEALSPDIRACEEAMHAPVLAPPVEPPVLPAPDPAALAAAGLIAPPPADDEDFAGVWMHAGGWMPPHGWVPGARTGEGAEPLHRISDHLEVLRIEPDGAVSVFVYSNAPFYNRACGDAAPPPECTNPAEARRGRLVREGGRLAIDGAEAVTEPFHFDRDIAAWARLQVASGDWAYQRAGNRLELTREVDGAILKRLFHRVGSGFPAAFHEFVDSEIRVSMVGAGCALEAIQADADLSLAFAAHLARLLPVIHRHTALGVEARASADPAVRDRYFAYRAMWDDQISLPGAAIVAPEGFDPVQWATMILAGRWQMTAPHEEGALFPAAAPLLPAIGACVEAHR